MSQNIRVLACSDLHGHLAAFKKALEETDYDPSRDQLVLLGDYIDRGPNSVETLDYVQQLTAGGAVALAGNHEYMLIHYLAGKLSEARYFANGGDRTIKDYFELGLDIDDVMGRHVEFIGQMPCILELDNYIFVHAGIDPTRPISDQGHEEFLWIRKDFIHQPTGLDKIVVFGHTPVQSFTDDPNVWFGGDKIDIDTLAFGGYEVSVLELPSGNVTAVNVKNRGVRRYNIMPREDEAANRRL